MYRTACSLTTYWITQLANSLIIKHMILLTPSISINHQKTATNTFSISAVLLDRTSELRLGASCYIAAGSMAIHIVSVQPTALLLGSNGNVLLEL